MKHNIDITIMYPNSIIEAELNVKRLFDYLNELQKRFEYRKKVEHSFNDFHVICALGKMKPSNPKSLKLFMDYAQLNDEQKIAKDKILSNAITILSGKAGSGKTLLACQVALDLLFKKSIQKIIITRPTVSKEEIGFLPGDLREKMEPWMQPIYANFYQLYNKEKIDEIIQNNTVEIVPVAFMRGRTFLDSFIIVDEAQNCTHDQMEMITSRLGVRSKMVICGDTQQVDLKSRGESGFKFLLS